MQEESLVDLLLSYYAEPPLHRTQFFFYHLKISGFTEQFWLVLSQTVFLSSSKYEMATIEP